MRKIVLAFIDIYQRFFSMFSHGSCRYYPTCSAYAKWQIMHNNIFIGIYKSILRILRCNGFFVGGIDYPIVKKDFKTPLLFQKNGNIKDIKFWFVPEKNGYFFVIKHINFTQ